MASQVENIKWVPGTKFMVDGFAFTNPKCQHYFLTHCHSDHTIGLRRSFDAGTIWCSAVSARLLDAEWNLRSPTVRVLQLNQPTVIDGVTVTALDANHCPGAVMLLFEVRTAQGAVKRILHTGDCRWQDRLYTDTCLAHKPIDTLMLDTTYALPKHTFPAQEEAVSMMVQLMQEALQNEPDTLLVVSSYHIGKERAYLGAAAALGHKVYVPPAKQRTLQLLTDLPAQLLSVVSTDPCSQMHVGCTSLAPDELQTYLAKQQQQGSRAWARVMGFRATGWSYRRSGGLSISKPSDTVTLVGIPYSEHSSWHDLRQCVARLRPKRLIPTVNAANRSQQEAIVDRFADLMDLSTSRSRIDAYLVRSAPKTAGSAISDVGATVTGSFTDTVAAAASTAAAAVSAAASRSVVVSATLGVGSDAPAWQYQAAADAAAVQQASQQQGCNAEQNLHPAAGIPAAPATASADGLVCLQASAAHPRPELVSAGSDSKGSCGTVFGLQQAKSASGRPLEELDAAVTTVPDRMMSEQNNFDFTSVNMSEQQRLLEDAERRQRLRKSLALQAASKQRSRRRTTLGVAQANILKKDASRHKL